MRRKFWLLGIILLLLSATANAQVRGGLKVGGNLNFPSWEPDIPFGDLSSALSFNLGGVLEFPVSKIFGIEVDLLYNSHKSEWTYSEYDPYYGFYFDADMVVTLQSLSLPVLAKFTFPSKRLTPFLGIGPELGLILSHKAKIEMTGDGVSYRTSVDLGDETKAIGFAITLIGGVDVNVGRIILAPELRFSIGVSSLDEDPATSTKNSQLIFLFGVKF